MTFNELLNLDTIKEINQLSGGYTLVTTHQQIDVLIDEQQHCCEEWGYLTTNDDLDYFIGSAILDIVMVDKSLNTEKFNPQESDDYKSRNCCFVNIETTKGTLQFVLYNEHNGFYSHWVSVRSNQLIYEGDL